MTEFLTNFYGNDFNSDQLKLALVVFKANFASEESTLEAVFTYLKSLSPSQRILISEVCKVAKLISVMLATNAVSEHLVFHDVSRLICIEV